MQTTAFVYCNGAARGLSGTGRSVVRWSMHGWLLCSADNTVVKRYALSKPTTGVVKPTVLVC